MGPKPQRFPVGPNDAELQRHDARTDPDNVVAALGDHSDDDSINRILNAGGMVSDFYVQSAPQGEARIHDRLRDLLWDYSFNGLKSLATQRTFLTKTNVFPAHMHQVMEGRLGSFWETQCIVGRVVPLKARRDPGSGRITFQVLHWTGADGRLKYVGCPCEEDGGGCVFVGAVANQAFTRHHHSWDMLSDTKAGCMNMALVRRGDAHGGQMCTFAWTTFGVVIQSGLYNNPKYLDDARKAYSNSIVNGMFFSPNSGTTWILAFYLKSPYQSRSGAGWAWAMLRMSI